MTSTLINGRWELDLPPHRAARPEWPWWEKERLASMCANLRAGDVVFDCGSEEGDLPGLWASWGCDVVLIEPNPAVWANPLYVWDHNGLPGPKGFFVGFAAAESTPGALAGKDGWPECAYGPVISDHGFAALCERSDLPKLRLDDLAEQIGAWPDAITMDVEGSELEVLKGASAILEYVRPLMWVSVHPAFMRDGYGVSPADLLALLEGHRYRHQWLGVDHEFHLFAWPAERAVALPDGDGGAEAAHWSAHANEIGVWSEPDWDAGIAGCLAAILPAVEPHVPAEHGRLLEVGCGLGRLTIPMAERFPTAYVHGVDVSVEMALRLDEGAAAAIVDNCRCLVGDGRALPHLADPVDAAYSVITFQHLGAEPVRGYLREVAGVLRAGGVFRFQFVEGDVGQPWDHRWPIRLVREWCEQAGLTVTACDRGLVRDEWVWFTAVKIGD